MRSRYLIAILVLVLVGFGSKLFFFAAPIAEANPKPSSGINISEMQKNLALPHQKLHDMTFVFVEAD